MFTVNEWSSDSRVELDKSLCLEDVQAIRAMEKVKRLILREPVNVRTLRLINEELLSYRPELIFVIGFPFIYSISLSFLKELSEVRTLQIYHFDHVRDLSVLEKLPKLQRLKIMQAGVDDPSVLARLPETMTDLSIDLKNHRSLDLSFLRRYSALQHLELVHLKKNIDAVADLPALRSLEFSGITLDDMSFFSRMPDLEALSIWRGNTNDFSGLENHPGLRWLYIFHVNKLDDVGVTATLPALDYLMLEQLRNVRVLPDYSRSKCLSRVILLQMGGLEDISGLQYAPHLKELVWGRCATKPKSIEAVLHMPSLEAVDIEDKKWENLRILARQRGLREVEMPCILPIPYSDQVPRN